MLLPTTSRIINRLDSPPHVHPGAIIDAMYVGNGGCPLPHFVLRFCIFGDPCGPGKFWGQQQFSAAVEDRWMGWKVFRLMMLYAKTSGNLPEFFTEWKQSRYEVEL